jgi:SAM-dependent methyltransferase
MNLLKSLFRPVREVCAALSGLRPFAPRTCPICKYQGFFTHAGRPPRIDAMCPSCHSLERYRLFWLWFLENRGKMQLPILHFAPEKILEGLFRKEFAAGGYKTADLFAQADLKLNIEALDLPDGGFSTVICNHVLEHVDDRKALGEIRRILADDGVFIVSVPIVEGWNSTYEDSALTEPTERDLHFGQYDHVRYYGSDFRDRLREAGFDFDEVTAEGRDVITYSLLRGEKFFICRKRQVSV